MAPFRGRVRLRVTPTAGDGHQREILTPLEWSSQNAEHIADVIVKARESFLTGTPLDQAVAQHVTSASSSPLTSSGHTTTQDTAQAPQSRSWGQLVEQYKRHKVSSGDLKPSTWDRIWRPRMVEVLAALQRRQPPQNARELIEAVTDRWALQPGARGRQMQVQQTAALLRWAVDRERLPDCWAPPLELAEFVGRKRSAPTPTTPMAPDDVSAMVGAIPDERWRFAFQLMAAYGLRPEELMHLERRGDHLHCTYRKVASRGSTEPRVLRLLPCDTGAAEWNLLKHYTAKRLPPLRAGECGEAVATYLKRRPLWQELRRRYDDNGERLIPYSLRHGYAHRAHVVLGLAPKIAAQLMGHSVQTHLAAYSRWCADDVVEAALNHAAAAWRESENPKRGPRFHRSTTV
ncbi:MAG: hypothetical protein VKO00_04100 [Cyanobacteriota bacterium]|nr:hypothetical protein [Cyanobacteriota bacterium]